MMEQFIASPGLDQPSEVLPDVALAALSDFAGLCHLLRWGWRAAICNTLPPRHSATQCKHWFRMDSHSLHSLCLLRGWLAVLFWLPVPPGCSSPSRFCLSAVCVSDCWQFVGDYMTVICFILHFIQTFIDSGEVSRGCSHFQQCWVTGHFQTHKEAQITSSM